MKVEFRVVIKVDEKKKNQKDQAKKVANTLKEKVKLGFVGKLKVKQLEFRGERRSSKIRSRAR